ncbi:hypothetical protein LK536_17555 [Lachnoclostridium pacaense]|uniref:hypothetical protein n=1 Tax=Enterocloster hominis (ex Hitch et al. 2024) TaxID=1917870 RepID=UPI001D120A4C|nr:hypothetical protein [Lachnoclostridium pacaense]MCC2878086.1 hypothetical protein [Lachnoclostridium pacaense]
MENIRKIGKVRVLYANDKEIWVASGMKFWKTDYSGQRLTPKFKVGTMKSGIFAFNRLSSQLLRVGIHHIMPLKNGNTLVSTKKATYIVDCDGKTISIFTDFRGNKPAQFGICESDNGYIYFGEYTINLGNDHPTSLYCSYDNGKSFKELYRFEKDQIRHIHFIQWDGYERCLWMGTGDKDKECLLMKSEDYGNHWSIVGQGSQLWRAIGIVFTPDFLYWGTDAGSVPDQNHVIRMKRSDYQLEIIADLPGPCHGITSTSDGKIYISTGVEGGENEKDRFARIFKVEGNNITEIIKIKKDVFPLILQYGVFHFPRNSGECTKLAFSAFGLKKNGESSFTID